MHRITSKRHESLLGGSVLIVSLLALITSPWPNSYTTDLQGEHAWQTDAKPAEKTLSTSLNQGPRL